MSESQDRVTYERQVIDSVEGKGTLARLRAYARLSGPGWLQSAITLGGGSLGSSLYLGVLGGVALLWLQPLAMVMGVIMLTAISYVTLSTNERPFDAIRKHINPVLAWGWVLATVAANIVWSLPQYALGTAALRQNLVPGLPTWAAAGLVLVVAVATAWFYGSSMRGVRVFEWVLKAMVALILLCFIAVVVRMSVAGVIDWGRIGAALLPDVSMLTEPADTFDPYLAALSAEARAYWSGYIVAQQRDVMIGAAAAAVGINMTFLMPYALLRKGWGPKFRGLAGFDLATGLFVPYIVGTACIVIAASTQFHTVPAAGLLTGEEVAAVDTAWVDGLGVPDPKLRGPYEGMLAARAGEDGDPAALPPAEKALAAMLVKRDAFNLADALEPLAGRGIAMWVFGLGVLAMAISSAIIMMVINGFAVCEMIGAEAKGWAFRAGSLIPAVGVLGPFVWTGDAKFWLTVVAGVFGMMLLPIAYVTFMLMMNSRRLMGDARPSGGARVAWNLAMGLATALAACGALWAIWSKAAWAGLAALAAFILAAVVVGVARRDGGDAARHPAPGGDNH